MKIPLPRLQRSKKSQNLLRVEFSQVFCFLRCANNECMSVTSVRTFFIFLQHSFFKKLQLAVVVFCRSGSIFRWTRWTGSWRPFPRKPWSPRRGRPTRWPSRSRPSATFRGSSFTSTWTLFTQPSKNEIIPSWRCVKLLKFFWSDCPVIFLSSFQAEIVLCEAAKSIRQTDNLSPLYS